MLFLLFSWSDTSFIEDTVQGNYTSIYIYDLCRKYCKPILSIGISVYILLKVASSPIDVIKAFCCYKRFVTTFSRGKAERVFHQYGADCGRVLNLSALRINSSIVLPVCVRSWVRIPLFGDSDPHLLNNSVIFHINIARQFNANILRTF